MRNAADTLAATDAAPPRAEFPSRDSAGVESYRSFLVSSGAELLDLLSATNPLDIVNDAFDIAQRVANSGWPASVGVAFSGDIGAALGVTGAVGASVSIGTQIGGGNTKTVARGDQSSVGETQSRTLYSKSAQTSHSVSTADQTRSGTTDETRDVKRTDHSPERRRAGPQVQYGSLGEDIILVTWPVQRRLLGDSVKGSQPGDPRRRGDSIRVRIDHLPPRIEIDVEFRGTVIPKRGQE